ncbi:MAG: multiprotein-bridging factor 1 family protein [Dongiaceae bacterium]
MIDAAQIRAARALLNWSQATLAENSNIAISSIKNIENEQSIPRAETIRLIQAALEQAGIEFLDRSGTRFKADFITIFKGNNALARFFDDIYSTLQAAGEGEILVSGVEEDAYTDVDPVLVDLHLKRLAKLGTVSQKVLCLEGDRNFTVPYAQYRWVTRSTFAPTPFYVYGKKLAMILWGPPPQIIIHNHESLAEAYRRQFMEAWRNAAVPTLERK